MWRLVGLRTRILLMLSALVLITAGGALVSLWQTYMMESIFQSVVDSELPAHQSAQALKAALIMQKGYVTYYAQDGDPHWIDQLRASQRAFEEWLTRARRHSLGESERDLLNTIESKYVRYSANREQVIGLYLAGRKEEGSQLQKQVRNELFEIIDLCGQYQGTHEKRIGQAIQMNRQRAETVYRLAAVALVIVLLLGLVLACTLIRDVLQPIRQLALGAESSPGVHRMSDEVKALRRRFEELMRDVDQTRSKLEWSREHLVQAEKWALLGKLAAGVAHSVRNPLTSVKMRLFSLERSLDFSPDEKEDFEVISEEIRHIDSIVSNFLEFSRPPKLKMQISSPSDAVDMAIQLLKHRLDSYNVTVRMERDGKLPAITMDPDQLKEVLVNLMVNACEAMVNGGEITIREQAEVSEHLGPVVVIKVSDNGPGIPEAIQGKMFQPFFSTKEEGTGLGLSIATRIVEEHGGWLDLDSEEGNGATFIIALPARGNKPWEPS